VRWARSVLITDVDNTLLDWVEVWHATFSAMVEKLVSISGVPRDQLLDEIREVHQRHGTSEYAFLVEEVPALRTAAGPVPPSIFYEDAIAEYGRVRTKVLRLYPTVLQCLTELRAAGVKIVAYTESLAYYTEYRFRKLGLDAVVDFLYSPADHDLPKGLTRDEVRRYPASHYKMAVTEHLHTPSGELKPNPRLLLDILEQIGAEPSDAVYVGDSLVKDVAMAQEAGVLDAHAAFGVAQHTEAYDLLRRVTHWSDADVKEESATIERRSVSPTIVLESNFGELREHVAFHRHQRRAA